MGAALAVETSQRTGKLMSHMSDQIKRSQTDVEVKEQCKECFVLCKINHSSMAAQKLGKHGTV